MGAKIDNDRLIKSLLSTGSIRQAADQAGVGEATIYRRLRDSDFRAELEARRQEATSMALSRLSSELSAIVDSLIELAGPEHPDSVRARVLLGLLDAALKTGDLLAFEGRLAEVEAEQQRQRTEPRRLPPIPFNIKEVLPDD